MTDPISQPLVQPDDPINELFALLIGANDALSRLAEFELRKHNLTMMQARILYFLVKGNRAITQNELSIILQRKFNSVSTLVQRMEKKGLVKKIKNSKERHFYVHITQKGIDINARFRKNGIRDVFLLLTQDERECLNSILCQLIKKTRRALIEKWKDTSPLFI